MQTHRTFAAAFSHRGQKPGEYAAELKKLYSKAHARRDPETTEEDLLRRFFDGLLDDKVRTQVEYVKEPKSIDEAVDGFMEANKSINSQTGDRRQWSARSTRMVAPQDEDEDEDSKHLSARVTHQSASKQVHQN